MHRRVGLFLIIIVFVLTGCTKLDDDIDSIIGATLNEDKTIANRVSTGYEVFIPNGVIQVKDNDFNQKLKILDRYVYLYVDTISYYYKNTLNYQSVKDYNYYYKEINNNGKTGYVGIDKLDDQYYCVVVYNYSKIEFYSSEMDLSYILANSLIILNNIKYNDNLISQNLENTTADGHLVKYEIDKPKDTDSTFSKYLQEYVVLDESSSELPDEEKIKEVQE